MKSNLVLFTIYILLSSVLSANLVQTQSSQQVESFYLSKTKCTIVVSHTDNNPVIFHQCLTQNQLMREWAACFTVCCSDTLLDRFTEPTHEAIRFCKTTANLKQKTLSRIQILCVAVLGATAVGALLVWCIIWKRKKSSSNQLSLKNSQNSQQEQQTVGEVEWNNQQQINFKTGEDIRWSTSASFDQQMRTVDESCSICLEVSSNAELHCGHQYHMGCIGDWLSKSLCCPCCRQQNIRGVKVYCNSCRWRYYICTAQLIAKQSKNIPAKCRECSVNDVSFSVEELKEGKKAIDLDSTCHS